MQDTIAISVVFFPLLAGIINGVFGHCYSKNTASLIASAFLVLSAIFASYIFYYTGLNEEILHILLVKWFTIAGIDINWAIYVDQLTCIMFIVVTYVSAIVHIYSIGYMSDDHNLAKFLSFLSFFTFFMLALVSADNFLQLFFGWEGVGLCSYLLIGYWYTKPSANDAAIKAFIVNRVGDFAFILGIILLAIYTEAIDFTSVFAKAKELTEPQFSVFNHTFTILDAICLLLFIGCMGKSAQIGLHVWLPDAMEGPTPVSALIHAATMVTAGVFLVARCSYLFEYSSVVLNIVAIIGAITCLMAATIAIAQSDIKKIIAYSTCSQLGYMFLACGVSAYQAAIFHLTTHAFYKALLFLSAGSVIHACHEQDIFKMGGLRKKMPITYLNFWLGSLAIIGIFPLAGFYSKDAILESAYLAGDIGQMVYTIGIIAAILTAIYSIKIIILTFHGVTRLDQKSFEHVHESGAVMNLPLFLLGIGSVFAGIIGHYLLSMDAMHGFFRKSLFFQEKHAHQELALWVQFLPLIVGVTGLFLGITAYRDKLYLAISKWFNLLEKLFSNKYYFDEIYNFIIVKPIGILSKLTNLFDQKAIDGFGPTGFARLTRIFGWGVSQIQTGYIYNYALYMILAIVICITYLVINFIKVV